MKPFNGPICFPVSNFGSTVLVKTAGKSSPYLTAILTKCTDSERRQGQTAVEIKLSSMTVGSAEAPGPLPTVHLVRNDSVNGDKIVLTLKADCTPPEC